MHSASPKPCLTSMATLYKRLYRTEISSRSILSSNQFANSFTTISLLATIGGLPTRFSDRIVSRLPSSESSLVRIPPFLFDRYTNKLISGDIQRLRKQAQIQCAVFHTFLDVISIPATKAIVNLGVQSLPEILSSLSSPAPVHHLGLTNSFVYSYLYYITFFNCCLLCSVALTFSPQPETNQPAKAQTPMNRQ